MPIFEQARFGNIPDKKEVVKIVKVCLYGVEPVICIEETEDDINLIEMNIPIRQQKIMMTRKPSQRYYRNFYLRTM